MFRRAACICWRDPDRLPAPVPGALTCGNEQFVLGPRDTVGPSPLRTGTFCLWIAAATVAPLRAGAVTFDGDLIYTSDYIFRGISQTGGRSAGQIDLRLSTADGTFVG